ncbi:MAG: hypothetical protein QNJ74_07920 [Trichodesmium sp. MO_231.B1]|nr:hypothetical protein [Trichodesmium sp. MO_231.B1]
MTEVYNLILYPGLNLVETPPTMAFDCFENFATLLDYFRDI